MDKEGKAVPDAAEPQTKEEGSGFRTLRRRLTGNPPFFLKATGEGRFVQDFEETLDRKS
jgi:hypothetical protein